MSLGEAWDSGDRHEESGNCSIKARIYAIGYLPQQGVWFLELMPEQPVDYKAGQYIDIAFNGLEPRSYSLAEAPQDDGRLIVHIKRGPGEVSQHMWRRARVNDIVHVSEAKGDNVYDPADQRPILAVAGGSGFTPLKAIIDEALRSNHTKPVWFFWGTRTEEEQYYKPYFKALEAKHPNFHFVSVVGGNVGDVAAAKFKNLSDFKIHICGPQGMINGTIAAVLRKGASPDSIWYDGKKGDSEPPPPPGPGFGPS